MKKIFTGVGKIVLAVFTTLIFGLMGVMSYETLGRVYPTDPLKQVWGLALFSLGTIAWYMIFLFASRSGQRPLALTLFIVSLVGEVVYSAADVFMGGQTWVAVDPRLGTYVLWTFIFMTFAHGTSLYVHFILDPDRISGIELETMQDQVQDEALGKAKQLVAHHLDSMAAILARRTMVNVLTDLSLPLPAEVIDVQAVEVSGVAHKAAQPAQAQRPGPTFRFKLPELEWPGFLFGPNNAKVNTSARVCLWCSNPIPDGQHYCSDEHELAHLDAIEVENRKRSEALRVRVADTKDALFQQEGAQRLDELKQAAANHPLGGDGFIATGVGLEKDGSAPAEVPFLDPRD